MKEYIKIKIILKSGENFVVECEEFNLGKNALGITSYSFTGIKNNKPLYLDLSEIAAIIREYN